VLLQGGISCREVVIFNELSYVMVSVCHEHANNACAHRHMPRPMYMRARVHQGGRGIKQGME